MGDQVCIFGGDRSLWDARWNAEAGMRKPVVGVTDRANQGGQRSEVCGGFSTHGTVADSFSVCHECKSACCFLLIEEFVEEDDLSGYSASAQFAQVIEVVDDDHIGIKAIGRSRGAAPEG